MLKMNLFLTVLFIVISFDTGLCKQSRSRKRTNAIDTSSFEYFTKQNNVITIPVMIHLDKALTKNLSHEYKSKTREKAKNMFRNILKNSEILFRRPSLNQTVKFTLLDVKFLRNATKKFVMDENVSNYLKSYCRWQGEKKAMKKKWYYSVLFTGLDVFYYGKDDAKVWNSTGRGYLRGICSVRNSCTLLEWQRTNISLKLTHEIGHSLGISHDGLPHNQCRADHHIMGANYRRNNPAKTWSPCSKRDFQQFLSSRFSWCLQTGARSRKF